MQQDAGFWERARARRTRSPGPAWSPGDGVVRTLRGDRIFRAGATPGSTEETHYGSWTTKPPAMARPAWTPFSKARKEKYLQQLEAYAGVMRKVHGRDLPLRLALYYPLLTRLVWW